MTWKKNNSVWSPEQQQAFEQIKWEKAHAVALEHDVKYMFDTAAGEQSPTWSLWQRMLMETWGQPFGFWSQEYRGFEEHYTPTEQEILAAYEGVQAALEVIGAEA